jgi:hypothetical protein
MDQSLWQHVGPCKSSQRICLQAGAARKPYGRCVPFSQQARTSYQRYKAAGACCLSSLVLQPEQKQQQHLQVRL